MNTYYGEMSGTVADDVDVLSIFLRVSGYFFSVGDVGDLLTVSISHGGKYPRDSVMGANKAESTWIGNVRLCVAILSTICLEFFRDTLEKFATTMNGLSSSISCILLLSRS